MKITGKSAYRLLSMALCICMVLSLIPAMPMVAEAATVPTYIASIGVSQDGSSGSTGINDCKSELAGHTIIDVDLNDEAGGDYVYMGYKTTTDPSQAITGIVFRVGKNPPNSISYGGATFYLVGGSTEANTAELGGYIDLNAKAGGAYIYTYVTRDTSYGAPLTNLTVNRVSTHYGWSAATDTDGNEMDLNYEASNYYMYLHYQRFSATVSNTFYYLDAGGSRFTSTQSGVVKNHLEAMTKVPSVPSTVTYNGRSFRFVGWREDDTAAAATTTSPSATYMTGNKIYRAVYEGTLTLSYDAAGGFAAPAAQTATQYINTGTSYISRQSHTFTIPAFKPVNFQMCMFDQWDGVGNNTTITIDFNKTLYAKWLEHTGLEDDNICDRCGDSLDEPTLSNGIYYISNRAQLIWFMQYVNSFGVGASAVLTADIDMSGYNWTPIASTGLYYGTTSYSNNGFTGTFDGQGHVISNLTVTGSSSTDGSYGLFGTVSGTVKNVGIDNFSFTGGGKDTRVGAVVGQMLDGSRVENCYATNVNINTKVNTNSGVAGGIAGCNYAGTVSNCYTNNVNITAARFGGIVGDNCGDISATDRMGTMEKCYTNHIYLRDPSKLGNALSGEAGVSAEWFASGEITWLLNGSSSDGVWKQTMGTSLPGFSGGTVYQVLRCDGKTITYSNSSTSPQAHTFVNNICTFCGVYVDGAVVSVSKNGSVIAVYTTLNDAIQSVANCTADDKAVVTILKDIALGDDIQSISSGVFTIDLNGHEISSTNTLWGALYITGSATNVTIQGTGENSKITGNYAGIEMSYCGNVTIAGGTISGGYGGVYASNSTVTIIGGSISGNTYDIINSGSAIGLGLGENGMGATFPGGIKVSGTTLNAILGEGAAYWQGNIMVLPADDATEIIGDVVIKSTCPHTASKSHYADLQNGASHTYFCSGCSNIIVESHSYTNGLCVCGAASPDAVASVSKNGIVTGAYTTLNDAIQAVKDCTAADQAVVTILQNIALGDSYQRISSVVFTIDLNGYEISSTSSSYGALYIYGATVTIRDSGEDGKITGKYAGIEVFGGELTILDGTVSGVSIGVYATGSSTVTISDGTISGNYGVYASFGVTVTISGGSISGGDYDIRTYDSTITLTLGDNGVGATFPDGITVYNTTLNAILGEGAAYWQGDTMILPADDATEITGGDVVIKATCPHTASKSNYIDLKDGANHTYVCSGCNNTLTEGHTYTDGLCICGAAHPDMVASVSKNGIVTGAYTTLNDAIQAVANCTAADKAVVTILKDIDLGDNYQTISSGEFTIDLNGHEISSIKSNYGALYINGAAANVTIQGVGENSKITGNDVGIKMNNEATLTVISGTISGRYGVYASSSTVTISGGTISSDWYGVYAYGSTVTITGGTISGVYEGVYAYENSTVTITGGTISGRYGVYAYENSTVTISGGSISGGNYDIWIYDSTITLTLGENGVGATFPGGIEVYGTTLNAILGEGAAYWQGSNMIIPADGATEISGGDVVIKAVCPHTASKTGYMDLKDGANHTYVCSGCNNTFTEDHTYTDDSCICGAIAAVASTTVNGVTTYHDTLDAAIQAVKDCTADDEAVVTILKDIALGNSYQTISSGVFTIDLNGHEISSTHSSMGVLYLRTDAVNVTIQGAGENSKITGSYDGIELYSATLTINGGTIRGSNHAVRTTGGTVTISGGSLSGGNDCVWADVNSTVTISGGTFSCNSYDLITTDSTITLTLGENGMGATFLGGIMVKGTTLNAILGEGAVYCQGNAMVIPADDATEISRGDVVIKAFCDHSGNVNVDDNDCSTHLVCSVCNLIISYSSDHDYDDNGFCVNCGDYQPAVLKDGWYQITNGGNLFWFNHLVNNKTSDANAVLTNDVDLEDRDWIPLGHEIAYEGIIDGAGYTVSGLKVSGNRQYSGFIGQLSNGGVKNLTLSGTVDATCNSAGYVGLMVGHMTDSALYNCSVSGSVKALAHTALYIGGLVGSANHCVIINCGSEADVTLLRGYSDEDAYVGGLAGEVKVGNENPVCLLNSYAVGNITVGTEENPWSGTVHAGGIVGYLRDDAVNNYFYGDIDVHCTGTANVGYAFGYVQGYSYLGIASSEDAPTELIISNNYYPEGKTAVGAGKIYVDGAGQSGIDESWTTAVSEANIKATSGENALVYILNSNVPYVERIIEEHLGFLSESEWAAIVENIGGKNFAAKMWVVKNGHPVHNEYSGWTEIDGDWYYFDPETGKPVTGITRVPYPAEAINGVTYAPNMEDVKYANDKGTLFKDSISAFFVFDENGVFQSNMNGLTSDNRWAVNGCIVWHVGLVQVGQDYYYFIGDVDNGGNKMATGDIYANRNTTDFDMVVGGVYTFGADGKLCKYEGITEVNGTLRYYENDRLMLGKGLTKVGENYIYVNSNGELIVDSEYYVPGNDLGIASGMYTFDENGFMVEPVSTDKDGIYFENDAWYYYKSGKKQYGLGLIGVSVYWYYPDGSRSGSSATIYVRSNGQLATGEYYVTNVDNYDFGGVASGTKLIFSEEGRRYASKNGIYEVDGNLYYFVGDQIQYNAGLIEHNGGWIYVRSNGQLAVGDYWITNTNGNMDQGMYEFGEDGYMVITDTEDGIVNDNGVLYYYLDGKKQYGLGLVQLDDGSYIYVRTNGELAVGAYWITNHNGLLPEGMYTFGTDGILTVN